MKQTTGLGRGAALLVASRVAIFLGTAVSTLVLARVMGPHDFGIVASATAIAGVLLVFGSFGLDQLYLVGTLDVTALRVRCTQVGVVAAGLVAAGAAVWPSVPAATRACVALVGAATAVDYLKLPWLLEPQKALSFARRAGREVVLRLGVAAAAVAGVAIDRSPVMVGAAMLVASVALVVPARALPRFDRRLPLTSLPGALRRGLPFAASGALYTLYFQVDMALLASLGSAGEVAQYRAAFNFMAAAVVLAVALNNEIMRPRLYRVEVASPEFGAVLRTSLGFTVAAGATGALALLVLGEPAVHLLFGSRYEAAGDLVQIMGLAVFPHFLNSWAGNSLVARRQVAEVVKLQAALVALNVAGNVVLIPSHGARGAAAMTVATEWAGTLLYGWALRRRSGAGAAGGPGVAGDGLGHQPFPEQEA